VEGNLGDLPSHAASLFAIRPKDDDARVVILHGQALVIYVPNEDGLGLGLGR